MRLHWALLVAVSLSTPAVAQNVQARFDAATAKLDAKDRAGALAELESLEAFLLAQPKPNLFNVAITRAMKANVLLELGRLEQARQAVDAALAGEWLNRPGLESLRNSAWLTSAKLQEADLDHAAATRSYLLLADKTTQQSMKATALIGAARTEMFVDAPGALRHINAALAIAEANENVGKEQMADILGLKGRILLNGGQYAEAKALLVKAVNLRGGLTAKIDLGDVALRADAGIAQLRLGDVEAARRYLAFSGAGHTDVPLPTPIESPLPPCGGDADIQPDDVAVIEFTVLDDGRAVGARPVFASRQGEMAYAFAQAVGDWSWDPDEAAKVKLFFRYSPRVEVRCTNAIQRPSLMNAFEQEGAAWFASRGAPLQTGSAAELAVQLKRKLDALPANDDSVVRLALLKQLQENVALPEQTRKIYADQALALARKLRAPQPLAFTLAVDAGHLAIPAKASSRQEAELRLQLFRGLLTTPEFDNPRIRATLLTLSATNLAALRRADEEIATLRQVVDMPELPERDPVKVAALVSLANAQAAKKDFVAAQAAYARTGLTAQQCALLDNGPVMTASGFGVFPPEALNWGFDGWTQMEYDVTADGRARNARVVAAYPPQVFSKASEDITRTVRYRVSFRPEGDTACTAMQRRVRFVKP